MEEENSIADNSDADSSLTINSTFSKALCIFCASVCPASFTVLDGKVIRIKEEDDDEEDKQEEIPSTNVEDVVLERQLRSMFIVRKILDVRASSCVKFLKEFEGQLDPEYWINICSECKSPVYDYYQAVMQINKLEVKMKHIKIKLKELITKSFGKNDENETAEGVTTTIWRELREEAINGTHSNDNDDKHSEKYFDAKEEPESHSNSMMEVDCEPTLMVKVEKDTSTATEDGVAYERVTGSTSPLVTEGRRRSARRNSKISSRGSIKIERRIIKPRKSKIQQLQPSTSTSHDVKPRLNGLSTPLSSLSKLKPRIFYKCEECNALIESDTKKLQSHERLHKTDGKGKKCKQCGWLVTYMTVHRNTWHSKKTAKMLRGNIRIRSMSERKKDHSVLREMDSSHHNYVMCRQFSRSFFKCRHCPGLETRNRNEIEEHSKLHDSHGHGATICDSCGWLIAEGKMRRHQAKIHNRYSRSFIETSAPVIKVEDPNVSEGGMESVSSLSLIPTPTLPKFFHRCEECGEGFKTRRRLRMHQHEEALLKINSLTFQESVVVASPATTLTLDGKPFTCNQCEKTFFKKCGLQTHIKLKHKLTVLPEATVNENESNESTNAQNTGKTDIEVNGVTEEEVAFYGSTSEPIKDVVTEPTSEVDPEATSDVIPEVASEVLPEATSDVIPEATSDVIPEATSDVIPEVTSEVLPEATSEIVPNPTSELPLEPTSEVHPEPASEVLPKTTCEVVPKLTSEVTLEPSSEVLSEATRENVPMPTSELPVEPTSEVVPNPTSKVVPKTTSKVVLERTSEVVPEPISELSHEQTSKDVSQPSQEVASGSTGQVSEACKNVLVPNGDAINLNGTLETK